MRRITYFLFILLLLVILGFRFYLYPRLSIINGYSAKMACSCAFISGRSLESIKEQDLNSFPLNIAAVNIDSKNKTASSHFLGFKKAQAVYKENLGCVLVQGEDSYGVAFAKRTAMDPNEEMVLSELDSPKLNKTIESAFDLNGAHIKKTRALVVLKEGKLVAEHYAKGFDKTTPILGWSMAKSICNTLVGIMVQKGRVEINQPVHIYAWQNDARKNISLHHLLQMQSGLEWEEVYTAITDVTRMLYTAENGSKLAASKQLAYPPGSHWYYSTGTTNIISQWLRSTFKTYQDYLDFPYKELFAPMGIQSAQLETDEAGTYVLSSYAHLNTRDWAKLGQLYLQDGIWNGQRILPPLWVDYSVKPAEHSEGTYGAHIWLNSTQARYPNAPKDMYYFAGFQGQRVFIIPSEQLVIARLGLTDETEFDMDNMIEGIINSLKG